MSPMSRAAHQVLRPIPKILENLFLLSRLEDPALAISDWANDQHTLAGKMLGRGLDHFGRKAPSSCRSQPWPYEHEAYRLWSIKQQGK
jgi:hypothetical protein